MVTIIMYYACFLLKMANAHLCYISGNKSSGTLAGK